MKNQYYADVNDYRKYGLLRCLARDPNVVVGVCWMLTPDDGRTDGRFTSYASSPGKWRRYDPSLFGSLAVSLGPGASRKVSHASRSGIVPNALYFEALLPDDRKRREAYFAEISRALAQASLIFFDPDNGLEVRSSPPGSNGSSKYLYWAELEHAYSLGHSVLVYQHFPRADRSLFIQKVVADLETRLAGAEVHALRTSYVTYFLAAHANHVPSIRAGLRSLAESWAGQIDLAENGGSNAR